MPHFSAPFLCMMLISLLPFLHQAKTSIILRCPPCISCPMISQSSCASGQLTKDNCLCCDVCARAISEDCGGWVYAGAGRTCADNLYCEYSPLDTQNDFNTGVCRREEAKEEWGVI